MTDLLLLAAVLTILTALTLMGYHAGKATARKEYQSTLAGERARNRRIQRDLELAREETALVRRAARGTH